MPGILCAMMHYLMNNIGCFLIIKFLLSMSWRRYILQNETYHNQIDCFYLNKDCLIFCYYLMLNINFKNFVIICDYLIYLNIIILLIWYFYHIVYLIHRKGSLHHYHLLNCFEVRVFIRINYLKMYELLRYFIRILRSSFVIIL